ncbi:MAG: hypothetical protein AAGG11_24125 [Pseudomonadota bacterium]
MTLKRIEIRRNGRHLGTYDVADESECACAACEKHYGVPNLRALAQKEGTTLEKIRDEFWFFIHDHLD